MDHRVDYNATYLRLNKRKTAMRLTKGLFLLVAASAVAVAATSLFMNAFPQNGTALADAGEPDETTDDLAAYAAECKKATGITIPDFSCLDGEEVPNQNMTSDEKCNAPAVLTGDCDPGARFQVLKGRTSNAVAVAHCRKRGAPRNQPLFNDIAIIQYNKKNGAICFYQALAVGLPDDPIPMPGSNIPSPRKGIDARWRDGQSHWMSPTDTEAQGCTGCHDNGGFIRSPYMLGTTKHKVPNEKEGFDNKTTKLRYVGAAFSGNKSWSITLSDNDGCTHCHRLAVSNHKSVADDPANAQAGSALWFSLVSTASKQLHKLDHGPNSPIWMVPPQVRYDATHDALAHQYHDCAVQFVQNNFQGPIDNCHFKKLGCPLSDSPNCDDQ
jgi:hypothetical protein